MRPGRSLPMTFEILQPSPPASLWGPRFRCWSGGGGYVKGIDFNLLEAVVRNLHAPDDVASLTIGYHSARKLCAPYGGYVDGSADHNDDRVEIVRSSYLVHGDGQRLRKITPTLRAA